jgi:pSer/pThr/pTyr-binding forkhead associated (FHA) protein
MIELTPQPADQTDTPPEPRESVPASERATEATPSPVRPSGAPPSLATLLVRSGSLKGQRVHVRVPIVNIGRAEYNDVVLPDDSVSTVHAKLQRREGIWVVVDLDSTNGTIVDGERVEGEAPLAPGAIVRFGTIQTIFEPTDDSVESQQGGGTQVLQPVKFTPPGASDDSETSGSSSTPEGGAPSE